MSYAMSAPIAVRASESARAAFIRRTYAHLAGAILAFACIEFLIFGLTSEEQLRNVMMSAFQSPVTILILFLGFIGVGWLARMWAHSDTSPGVQYFGLALYVIFQAIFFVPILWVAVYYVKDPTIIPTAGILTLAMFAGLTLAVFTTGKDFSFLRPIISIACAITFGVILCAIIFPASINLGLWFSLAMIGLASAFILYDTSNVLHHFRTDQHVAAALELFASVAFLFFYVLRVLIYLAASRE
jgi:FtsH-binding integral membrane protein